MCYSSCLLKGCGSNWIEAQVNSGLVSCRGTSRFGQHQWEQGQEQSRVNAGWSRSTGYDERHCSKTDWANLTCPLIGTALLVVPDGHAPSCCFNQW